MKEEHMLPTLKLQWKVSLIGKRSINRQIVALEVEYRLTFLPDCLTGEEDVRFSGTKFAVIALSVATGFIITVGIICGLILRSIQNRWNTLTKCFELIKLSKVSKVQSKQRKRSVDWSQTKVIGCSGQVIIIYSIINNGIVDNFLCKYFKTLSTLSWWYSLTVFCPD